LFLPWQPEVVGLAGDIDAEHGASRGGGVLCEERRDGCEEAGGEERSERDHGKRGGRRRGGPGDGLFDVGGGSETVFLEEAGLGVGGLFAVDDERAAFAGELDEVEGRAVFLLEGVGDVFEPGDFDAVDFLDDLAGEFAEPCIDFVGEDIGEDDWLRFVAVEFVGGEVLEPVAGAEGTGCGDGHERFVHGLEDETGEHDVLGLLLVAIGLHEVVGGTFESDFDGFRFAVADDFEGEFVAGEFAFDDFCEFGLFAIDVDGAVAFDGVAIDFEDDVAGFEGAAGGAFGVDGGDHDAEVTVFGEPECFALGWVHEGEVSDAEVDEAVVFAVFDVLEETAHDWGGDHVAGVLGDIAAVALEGDTDDHVFLEDWAAGVAWVDGGIDLDGEVLIGAAVGVFLVVDAADDPAGDGDAFAADGEADDLDGGVEFGNFLGDFEGFDGGEGGGGFDEFEEGEVAVVGDVFDASAVGCGVADLADDEAGGVADHVGVGHEEVFCDEEAGAGAAAGGGWVPWGAVVDLEGIALDVDDALVLTAEGGGFFAVSWGCLGRRGELGEGEGGGEEGRGGGPEETEGRFHGEGVAACAGGGGCIQHLAGGK